MKPTFRPYQAKDHADLIQMALDFYKETPSIKNMDAKKISRTVTELATFPEKGLIMIFDIERQVVGYAILILFWSNEYGGNFINVDELYVQPTFRNQGLGSAFIDFLKKEKMIKGIALQLEVHPKNKRAHDLYTRMGFEEHVNTIMDLEL